MISNNDEKKTDLTKKIESNIRSGMMVAFANSELFDNSAFECKQSTIECYEQ